MLHKPFKRRLASCLCAMLAATCVLSSLPVGATSGSYGGYAASAAAEETVNWALGKSYDSTIESYHGNNDPQLTKLTDGQFAANYDSDGRNLVGFSDQQEVTFTFDLEKTREVQQIIVSGYDKNEYSIHNPENVTVEYYDADSDNWIAAGTKDFGRSHSGVDDDAEGNYRLAVDVSFSAQMVRVRMTKDTGAVTGDTGAAWCMLDEIEILGAAAADMAGIPVITTNLPTEKSVRVGEAIELFVEAEGNGDLSYQWYQDGSIIEGETGDTYYVDSAETFDSGVYTVIVTNTVGDSSETATSKACVLKVKDTQATNLLAGIPFTTSMVYGDPNAGNDAYPQFGGSEGNYINNDEEHIATEMLTDGIRSENFEAMGKDSARFNKHFNDIMYADFMFDLGAVKDFSQLNISCLGDTAYAIVMPTRLQVLVSNDEGQNKNWTTIFDSPLDNQYEHHEYVIATENNKTVSARFVKLNLFFGAHTWITMDEIEIYDETTGDIPDGIIGTIDGEEPEDDSNNLALNKTYTVNNSASADVELKKLTDGVKGVVTGDGGYDYWVNFPRVAESSSDPAYKDTEIIIDLEDEVSFQQIETNFLHHAGAGIVYPEWIKVEYSSDKATWNLFGEQDVPSYSGEPNIFNCQVSGSKVTARYVKVTMPALHWVFVDEIKVLKDSTSIEEGEAEQDNYDKNNIAYGCSYTPSWRERDAYKDNGKKLTDGRRGPMKYSAPEWVGYHGVDGGDLGPEDFYITVDLGDVKTFEQVKFGTLKEGAAGIPYAISAQIETSVDGSTWTSYKKEDLAFGVTNGVGRYIFTADEPISARYVKVNIGIDGSWLFVDEIEVLAQKDTREDASVNPDNGIEYNLVRGYTNYNVSRTPDMNNRPGILTDGKYMTAGTKYDKAWMGFKSNRDSKKNHVSLTFDLYAPASISQIILSSKYDLANNQTIPQNLKIYTSHDKANWFLLKEFDNDLPASGNAVKMVWDGKVDEFKSVNTSADMVSASYVRLEFDVPSDADMYAVIDEVKIMGKLGHCSTAGGLIEVDTDGSYNVAAGKSYDVWPESVEYLNYSDPSGAKLTDGIVAAPDYSDSGWVGFHQFDNVKGGAGGDKDIRWPNKSIVIDLGETKSIKNISYNILYQGGAGLTHPWASRAFVSMDGDTWVEVSRTSVQGGPWKDNDASYAFGWRCGNKPNAMGAFDFVEDIDMIAARYVRVDLELFGWNFIDEISVMGFDGLVEGATPADFGKRLENGHNYTRVGENTDYIQDMVLIYNGNYGIDEESGLGIGDQTPEKFRPLLTYIDNNNRAVDTMFDGFLFLGLTSQYRNDFYSPDSYAHAGAKDWIWYLDKTFKEGGDMDALEEAARIASEELNDPNYQVKAVVMFPNTNPLKGDNFGALDERGNLDMNNEEDWKYATDWWTNEVVTRFEAKNYKYVKLSGIYWLNEQADYVQRIKYWEEGVHALGLKTYWIPYFHSSGYLWPQDLGFDATAYQMNHFFDSAYEPGGAGELGNKVMANHAARMNYAGTGAEFELDGRVYEEVGKYNQFIDYLNAAVDYGYDGPGYYRNWYFGRPITELAASGSSIIRSIYDNIYQVMKGTYERREYLDADDFPRNPDIGGFYSHGVDGEGLPNNGGSIGGGSSGGGGSTTPSKPTNPETPSTDGYTWEEVDGSYKLKDADGEYVTGWAKVSGKWYYLDADGIRATGWQKVDNKWYYLKSDGVMATGWLYNGGVWYYLYEWGGMANTSWVQVGNTWYYFRGNGAMFTGWLQQGSTWYYLKASGAMATGWNWVGSNCYYFAANGKMAANTTIGGYKVDANGAWVK